VLELEAVHMVLSTALYRRSLLSVDSVDLLPSSHCICFDFRLSCFLLPMSVFYLGTCPGISLHFSEVDQQMPICTVRQVWLHWVNVICVRKINGYIFLRSLFAFHEMKSVTPFQPLR
jgi:hypothetical protein